MADAPTFDEIAENFDFLEDWEERYRYVIELGKAMPELPESMRNAATKVDGCASQVWIAPSLEDGPNGPILHFQGDSDAHIVRGLIAILHALLSGRPAAEILNEDAEAAMARLGLDQAISKQRSNGLKAMIQRLKALAGQAESVA
jgi:cysteine desulfuration protein SufE